MKYQSIIQSNLFTPLRPIEYLLFDKVILKHPPNTQIMAGECVKGFINKGTVCTYLCVILHVCICCYTNGERYAWKSKANMTFKVNVSVSFILMLS